MYLPSDTNGEIVYRIDNYEKIRSNEVYLMDLKGKVLFSIRRKVCPDTHTTTSYMTSKRETFTVWMKSLVFHGNGCTVFDTNGEIVYRIDNYEKIRSNEVYLMDLKGKVLFSIRRKKVVLPFFSHWDIYKWSCGCKENKERRTWFQARKNSRSILGRGMACRVTLGRHDKATSNGGYTILGLAGKLSFKITDSHGQLVAEVKQKQLSSGVMLGDDVLTMVVEPQMDHSIVMALVTVYGLMRERFE